MTATNNKLSNFTDILNDELPNSPPISLPSSYDSQPALEGNVSEACERRSHFKHAGQKGEFRCVDEIDPKYRDVFTYPYFNLVQSRVIEDALYSDKSMAVCAPTGSGKTVIFEMAIVQLLMEMEEKNYMDDYKIIYMAPVKALCSERLSEWYPKFTRLGLLCIEVTGDTDVDFPQLKPYRIIITTPEKWDMLTRRWKDHRGLVEVIKLFLIDEVHILNDELRGPVLEAVVSRMKTVESSAQSSHRIEQLQRQYEGCKSSHVEVPPPRIRFVAVSATVSNPEDVATWLGTKDRPAVFYKFGDECRPVTVRRVVEGYPCPPGASIFKFDIILNYKIWPIIQRYHDGKPTLIFCNTRKSVVLTAETLSREITVGFSPDQRHKLMEISANIKTKKIQSLILSGVGCHHAGLLFEERQLIEKAFRNRELPILITTTTLAMGVNLPAHLVIIKNTQQYVKGTYQEYSISTILQMVGRAGRPQFDTEATAVIMTRLADKARYQALVGGCEPLQSYLHKRLAENLNSEAALSTVCDVAQCVQWLNSTFLSVRAARDPRRYLGLPHTAPANHISKKIEELCVKAMNGLASAGLITMDEACCIESTEAGRLMSIYYLDLETMKLIMKINGTESLEQLLLLVCESHELADMHLRVDERRGLNALNRNNAAPTIRYPMKGKINTRQMKSNCVIQAILGCLPIPDPSLNQEATKIIRIAERVCKCLVAYMTRPNLISQKAKYFSAVLNSLVLAKCVCAHLWENSPYMSKQLRGIGPALSALLASAGKVNFTLIEESHPRDLERIMNKTPPAGNILRKQVSLLPKYRFKLIPLDDKTVKVQLSLINAEQLAENLEHLTAGANHKSYIVVGDTENYLIHFSAFRDSDLIRVYDGCITFEITRLHNHEHKIMVHCISSNFVGLDQQCEHVFQNLLPSENKTVKMSNRKVERIEASEESLVAKSNKRKYTNDKGQCKEKKKRENNLIETLNNLKESFYKSTKDIKSELDKTKELSNSILHDILEPGQEINGDKKCETVSSNSVQNHFDINEEAINASDDIGDDKITSILKDIENEMSAGDNYTVKTKEDTNIYHNKDPNYKEKEATNIGWSRIKHSAKKYNKKYLHDKNNYSFLDTLEKEENVGKEFKETPANVGLSNEIKEQIKQFLEKSHGNSENTKLINFTTIYDMTDKLPNIESEECNITDRKYRNNESEQVLSEVYSNKASSVENSQQHLETSNTKDAQHFKKVSKVIEKNSIIKPNYLETSNKLKFDKINTYNDNIVNETSDSNNSKGQHEAPLPSTIEKFNNLSNSNKLNLCNEDIHPTTETLDVDTFNLGPVVPISPTIDKSRSLVVSSNKQMLHNKSDLGLLKFNNKYLNNSVNNNSPDNFRSDQYESYKSILCSFPSNAAEILNNTNTSQNDRTSQSHNTSTEDYEFLSNFTYSASKINIITKNDSNRRIQIVNKLKIDLNIAEFIYKGTNSEHTPTDENINRKIEIEARTERTPHDITLDEVIEDNVSNNDVKDRIMVEENGADRNIENNIDNCARDNTQISENNGINDKSTIKSIIEKYKMKTKERNDAQQKLIKPVCNNKFTPIVKSNRQYRIRDLHKAENTCPANLLISDPKVSGEDKGLVSQSKQYCSITLTALTNKNNFMLQAPENDIVPENINDVANLNHFKYSAVDEDSLSTCTPIETEDIKTVLTESETNEINVSMFNPKTMLQCLGEDVLPFEEVIPPPLDFCDSDPYSPIQSEDRSMPGNGYTPLSSPSTEIEHFGSTLPNSDQVETWTLSHESDDDSDSFNKFQPHRVFTSQNKGHKFASREIKLSQFRFDGRPKFKK